MPTALNWPVDKDCVKAFTGALQGHDFQPLNEFYLNRSRVNPTDFEEVLPGAIVEVRFSMHVWSFQGDVNDSFNAKVKQVIILRPSLCDKDDTKMETGNAEERIEPFDIGKRKLSTPPPLIARDGIRR